jgi:hypothetical protein
VKGPWDFGIAVVYAGLFVALAGIVSLARPPRFFGVETRRAAAGVLGLGLLLAVGGALLPAPMRAPLGGGSRLDHFVPAGQFGELHSIRVRATPDAVFRAVKSVTAREIRFFRLLTWIRAPRWKNSRETILSPPPDKPLLDVALRSGFLLLDEVPGREIVIGTVLCGRLSGVADPSPGGFVRLSRPGFCKAAMNFRLDEEGAGWVRLTTETRILALGASARRRFAAYWRVIYPGSALIRRMWLEAIRRRAEDPRTGCREELEDLTRPLNETLATFEAEEPGGGGSHRAKDVLSQARVVREKLEAVSIEPACVESRGEALVFVNHVILGFQAFLDAGEDPRVRAALDAILRRARAHQSRVAGG